MRRFGVIVFAACVAGLLAGACQTPGSGGGQAAAAYRPALDPRVWRADMAGARTEVAVLGMAHLSQIDAFDRASLEPLLQKLAAFGPTVITHEGLSGETCETIQRNPAIYPGVFDDYCDSSEVAQKAAGLDFAAARAEVEARLAAWPQTPSPSDRRRLALLFLASSDRMSALVQWRRLPEAERRTSDGIDADVMAELDKVRRPNESIDIAVALAVRLGLERVHAVDDHTADSIQTSAGPGFEAAIQAHWAAGTASIGASPAISRYMQNEAGLAKGGDFLEFIRHANAPATSLAFVELDYHGALKLAGPELYGRQYVAWWEVRNLRMVANMRSAFGNAPGARVLNIVGTSHKPYYEAYLDLMHEVELVDIEVVLK